VRGAPEADGEEGLRVRKGVVQDATFITADPGRPSKPRGEQARTRRSRDGDWAKREGRSVFGYKLHAKTDTDQGLVRDLEVTPASVHDSRVDLSKPGEVVYRDKGYFRVEPRGFSATMRARGFPGPYWCSPVQRMGWMGVKSRFSNSSLGEPTSLTFPQDDER